MIMNVAVPWCQHSPMLGQCASSQTVCSLSSRIRPLGAGSLASPGARTFSHSGLGSRASAASFTRRPRMNWSGSDAGHRPSQYNSASWHRRSPSPGSATRRSSSACHPASASLTDPWLGNPNCPPAFVEARSAQADRSDPRVARPRRSLGDVVAVARATGAPVVCIFELGHVPHGQGPAGRQRHGHRRHAGRGRRHDHDDRRPRIRARSSTTARSSIWAAPPDSSCARRTCRRSTSPATRDSSAT